MRDSFIISVFRFSLDVLSFGASWVLKYPTINVWDLMCYLHSNSLSFTVVKCPFVRGTDVHNSDIILVDFSFNEYEMSFPVSFD